MSLKRIVLLTTINATLKTQQGNINTKFNLKYHAKWLDKNGC